MKRSSKIPAAKTTKPAAKHASKDAGEVTPTGKPATAKPRDLRLPPVGTTAVREYKGKDVKLKYLADGVEVDGKHFGSLSAAARHVTGAASINGFLFWGLIESGRPAAMAEKPTDAPIGNGNDLGTPGGQRAALAAAGIAKRGRPVSKPRGPKAVSASPAKRGKNA